MSVCDARSSAVHLDAAQGSVYVRVCVCVWDCECQDITDEGQ